MIDFDKSKRFRRLCIGWAMIYATGFTAWMFLDPPNVSAGLATVMVTIIGVVATMVNFYMGFRAKEERQIEQYQSWGSSWTGYDKSWGQVEEEQNDK